MASPPRSPAPATSHCTPHKRAYIPSSHSLVNDIKKRRLLTGFQGIQPNFPQTPIKTTHENTLFSPNRTTNSSFNAFFTPQRPKLPSHFLSRDESEWMEISQRPRFKARPVPKTQYQPSLVIKSSDKPLTVPVELNVFSHARSFSCSSRCSTEEIPTESSFKAREMPDFSVVNLPQKREFVPTQPQPFDLKTEERGREKSVSMRCKVELERQNELKMMQFEANPLPIFLPPKPIISTRPETVPQPFNFCQVKNTKLKPFPEFNAFKAKPMPNFSSPFAPVLEGKHTEPMEIELHSDLQSQRRAVFEEQMREKQRRMETMDESQKAEREKREVEDIKKLRGQMEFAARPMPVDRPFVVQRSSQLLTVPVAPFLHTAERAGLRSQCTENFNPNISQAHSHASTHCSEVSMSLCEETEAMDLNE